VQDDRAEYRRANQTAVAQVIQGIGPEDKDPKTGAGSRIVFNMACAHIPSFCNRSSSGEARPYQNAYDLGRQQYHANIAGAAPKLTRRESVDKALEYATGLKGSDTYFGAAETSGTGVRFYGDMCLVLSSRPLVSNGSQEHPGVLSNGDCYLLDRNSYDVLREPANSAITATMQQRNQTFEVAAGAYLARWLGTFGHDLARFATEKIVATLPDVSRRWTTGAIAEAVLQDEDYFEVLREGSFGTRDLLEVRVTAADAAAEADIAGRERSGEVTGLHELEWRQQRREARRALALANVPVRIVTTLGRLKAS
jgi:hypothetical protein